MQELYLGVDLGTTNSKAAFLDFREIGDPQPTTLKLHQTVEKADPPEGWNHLPSVVLFEPDGANVYVGEYARRYAVNFPARVVRAVKRLMGKTWRHEVPGWHIPWTPQGISAIILRKVRSEALDDLRDEKDDLASVTISVPASFGSRQREATIQAAELAGFCGRVSLIDEPSAALIHYIYDQRQKGSDVDFSRLNRVLVFDMGGGTLDVSLAEVEPKNSQLQLSILSRSRYTELAGTEFDLRLAAYIVRRLALEGISVPRAPEDRRDLFRVALFDLAEPLKKDMGKKLASRFNWGAFLRDGDPFSDLSELALPIVPPQRELTTSEGPLEIPTLSVAFEHFKQVLEPFFKPEDPHNEAGTGTIYGPVYTALGEAGLAREDIDIVLMHGGMCELPLIQAALMGWFPAGTTVTVSPSPMTSVAQGAALYHARERRGALIDVQEPALFESIFYEHQKGFELAVDKNRKVGQHGEVPLEVDAGTKTIRLELYQGFDKDDPLLTHDRDIRIELPRMTREDCVIKLRWEIMENRTVSFAWRDPAAETEWQSLQELSSARRDVWYPQEVRDAEAENVRRIQIH